MKCTIQFPTRVEHVTPTAILNNFEQLPFSHSDFEASSPAPSLRDIANAEGHIRVNRIFNATARRGLFHGAALFRAAMAMLRDAGRLFARCLKAVMTYFYPTNLYLTPEEELTGAGLILDEPDVCEPEDYLQGSSGSRIVRKRNANTKLRYCRSVAALVKVAMQGTPSDTVPNRKIAARHAAVAMEKHGVRPTHITFYVPLTVEMVMTPTADEIEANRYRQTAAAQAAKIASTQTVFSRPWYYKAVAAVGLQ